MTVLGRAVLGVVALSLTMLADCQESADGTESVSVTLPSTEVCGKPSGRFNRIVGGSDAEPGMFPWIAAIGYRICKPEKFPQEPKVASNLTLFCTGSLVTEWHLITSGMCVSDMSDKIRLWKAQSKRGEPTCRFVAVFGLLDLNHVEATGTEADYEFDTLLEHPDCVHSSSIYHIGIIKLKKRITFSRFIQPICLPVLSEFKTKNITGSTAYIAGWRWIKYDGEIATRMQKKQVRVWDLKKCRTAYRHHYPIIRDNDVCADNDDPAQECEGPLMMQYGPDCNYYLYGLPFSTEFCGSAGWPGKDRWPAVFYRVSEGIDWILSNLK